MEEDMIPFAIFASGTGSNLQRFIEVTRCRGYPGRLAVVVSDRPGCYAVARARAAGFPVFAFEPRDHRNKAAYEHEVLVELRSHDVRWLVLAGYMRILGPTVLDAYPGHIVNVHPSLLPRFAGKDAIGQALRAGVMETGVTVHLVDEGIDTGPPLAQWKVPILPGDTPETLAERIHAVEHALYPAVVGSLLQGEMA
jgi:phosphoribosylglycinamide formyltransferase-1